MERGEMNGPLSASSSGKGRRPVRLVGTRRQPDYNRRPVQEALERLASIDLSELVNEAKVEHCRATRDLRSCGRYVEYTLNSCGHASLCKECSQRCDLCPICRVPLPKNGDKLRRRLYDECVEAGLISRKLDERFQDREDKDDQLTADVQRLYSFFDIAMENNLISLICHYIADVCMDETAVSSDVVTSWLLDEKVVKDWVRRTYQNIIKELKGIYNLEEEELRCSTGLLLKLSGQLAGLSTVLEALESLFKDSILAHLNDLNYLQESILKTKQHLEITLWCARHQFLENVKSCHASYESWCSVFRDRKSAATKRAWPDVVNHLPESPGQEGSLFLEDALANVEIEQGYSQEGERESDFAFLGANGAMVFFKSKIEGLAGCYPFENVRAAVDILFLHGSSDLEVAKQAIFLYYLVDRHWKTPTDRWRHIIDDFAANFGVSRHSLLESFVFFLLDDHSDEALQEACQLLPEISGPATHPKIAQVLLERQNPQAALMVLRWSGRDGGSQLVSLSEAVTGVRVRMECGLITEAFMFQRMLCTKFRERMHADASDQKSEGSTWLDWVEVLVTEVCCLCIRRNLVDRMIELPWNSDEEKHIRKCLFDCASDEPSTTLGSLLVVFYLQRFRYLEAYQVHLNLWRKEEGFLLNHSFDEAVLSRMESLRQRRKELVDRGIELLPEVQQQQVKAGTSPDIIGTSGKEDEMPLMSDLAGIPEPTSISLLASSASDSFLLRPDYTSAPSGSPNYEISKTLHGPSPALQGRLVADGNRTSIPGVYSSKGLNFDEISTPGTHKVTRTQLKGTVGISLRGVTKRPVEQSRSNILRSVNKQNGFINQFRNTSPPYSRRVSANPLTASEDIVKDSSQSLFLSISGKRGHSERDDALRDGPLMQGSEQRAPSFHELMDASWSLGEKSLLTDGGMANGGLRWRSDEASDEEEDQSPDRAMEADTTPLSRIRRSRLSRR